MEVNRLPVSTDDVALGYFDVQRTMPVAMTLRLLVTLAKVDVDCLGIVAISRVGILHRLAISRSLGWVHFYGMKMTSQ
jgi:hypothetical protein